MNLRSAAVLFLAVAASAAPSAGTLYSRYVRAVQNTPQKQLQTCAALPADVFAHAAPQLADLRLVGSGREIPYVVRIAAPVSQSQSSIQPLNLGERQNHVVFDAAMPEGHYSDVELSISATDFIATVDVTGSQTQSGTPETRLGSYTIFDFSRQKLGRSTILHLTESDLRYLHVRISAPLKPEQISGLTIDRIPESKAQYVTVADTSKVKQENHLTKIEFIVPANVPVDRIEFVPGANPASFSRTALVTIELTPKGPIAMEDRLEPISFSGNLLRIHGTHDGHRIDDERLMIETGQTALPPEPTTWDVVIDNGDDAPIALKAVRLEMLQRTLCFDAAPETSYRLYYGDPALAAPRYDFATLFTPEKDAAQAAIGPEEKNPEWQPRPDTRPFTEKHPGLLWTALIVVIALLGGIALRSGKQIKSRG
jgi:hypothetical protein